MLVRKMFPPFTHPATPFVLREIEGRPGAPNPPFPPLTCHSRESGNLAPPVEDHQPSPPTPYPSNHAGAKDVSPLHAPNHPVRPEGNRRANGAPPTCHSHPEPVILRSLRRKNLKSLAGCHRRTSVSSLRYARNDTGSASGNLASRLKTTNQAPNTLSIRPCRGERCFALSRTQPPRSSWGKSKGERTAPNLPFPPPTRHSEELATKESQMPGRLPPSDFRCLATLRSERHGR